MAIERKYFAHILQHEHVRGKVKIDWDRYDVYACNPNLDARAALEKAKDGAHMLAAYDMVFVLERESLGLRKIFYPEDLHPDRVKTFLHLVPSLDTYARYTDFVVHESQKRGFTGIYMDDSNVPHPPKRQTQAYKEDPIYYEAAWLGVREFFYSYIKGLWPDCLLIGNTSGPLPIPADGLLLEGGTINRIGWSIGAGIFMNNPKPYNVAFQWDVESKYEIGEEKLPPGILKGERLPPIK